MTDIIERLRNSKKGWAGGFSGFQCPLEIEIEAADEIERLRKLLSNEAPPKGEG